MSVTPGSIRLCIVTPHHPSGSSGGAEFQIECLLEALIPTGRYEISYVAHSVAPNFRPPGYQVAGVGSVSRPPRLGYSMDAVPLYRILRKLQPHVIYQRVACGYSGICAWYARRNGAKMIWHVAHDTDVSRVVLDRGRNPIRPLLDGASIGYAIRHTSHIVTQTRRQSELLEANYRRRADAIIPNFHPLPRETLDKSGSPLVVWVANFKRWKRPELFLDLAASLSDLKDVRFVMVGAGGAGDWNDDIMRRAAAQTNVEYLGHRSQEEVNRLLATAHVLVNTSVSEGFPNTFIAAWLRSVPVVSVAVDPDDVLQREAIGIKAETSAALIEAVRMLVTHGSLRAEYGERARRYALDRHSLRNADRLMELIDAARQPLLQVPA